MHDENKALIEWREKFSQVYDESNYSGSLPSIVMRASHRVLEKELEEPVHFGRVREVGAGSGEHFPFVRHGFDEYTLTDIDPKTPEVALRKLTNNSPGKVAFEVLQSDRPAYSNNPFDRLVATHVLEHLYQPRLILKEWKRVLNHRGVISILIPTVSGIAWRLDRHLGSRKNAISQDIQYDYVMAREHVNSRNNLVAFLRHYFPKSKELWWPFQTPSIDVNLFFAFHATLDKWEGRQ